MMRQLVTAFIAVALVGTAHAQTRIVEKAEAFSYTLPANWKTMEYPGVKSKVVVTTPQNGFAANVNFAAFPSAGALEKNVDTSLVNIPKLMPGAKVLGKKPVTLASGLKAIRAEWTGEQQGKKLRFLQYYIEAKKNKTFVATLTTLREDGAKHDAAFDGMMRSFQAQ